MRTITLEISDAVAEGLALWAARESDEIETRTPEAVALSMIERALMEATAAGRLPRIPGNPMDDDLEH